MSVSLRLSRGGSKKRPYFRIVAADIRSPRDGKYLERLGTYNPMKKKDDPERVSLNLERIKYWLSVGAKPTDKVNNFLATQGLTEKKSIPNQTKQNKPKKKTLEKIKAKEEKLKSKQDMENATKEVSSDGKIDEKIKEIESSDTDPKTINSAKEEIKAESPPAKTEPTPEPAKEEIKAESPPAKTEPTSEPAKEEIKAESPPAKTVQTPEPAKEEIKVENLKTEVQQSKENIEEKNDKS